MPNPPADQQPPEASVGMGSTPSGPSFAPGGWQSAPSEPVGPPPAVGPEPGAYAPPRSVLPAVLTAVAIGVVALVVVVASAVAYRADQEVSAPPSRSVRTPQVTATKDSIEFTSRTGSGRLVIVDHSWQPARTSQDQALQVRVRIVCTSGMVDYDPFDFQAFDASGNLFDLAPEEIQGQILGVGILEPGDDVTGLLAFVIPRGEVTLLMSDDASSVTALKIPD